jgi:hypothetical protein
MKPGAAACPTCQATLTSAFCNTPALVRCPACRSSIQIDIFPAFFKSATLGSAGETIIEDGVASCFYHDRKKAVVHCGACGRFLCALCDLEMDGKHYCPACLQVGRSRSSLPQLENRRTLYDSTALSLSVIPIFWFIGFITAPIAIYLAILSFFRPSSIAPRTRLRAWIAIVVAVAQIVVWGWLVYRLFESA